MVYIWRFFQGTPERHTSNSTFQKYNVKTLVYHEQHESSESAIHREKRIKEWGRKQKLLLIERNNPTWCDLYESIV